MFQIDRMAWNRQRTQDTGLVSCCKNLYRKFTANNIGDLAKEADLGDVTTKPGLGGGGLVRLESVSVCVCVCCLEEASQLKIWVGEKSQVGGGLWNILS